MKTLFEIINNQESNLEKSICFCQRSNEQCGGCEGGGDDKFGSFSAVGENAKGNGGDGVGG